MQTKHWVENTRQWKRRWLPVLIIETFAQAASDVENLGIGVRAGGSSNQAIGQR